MIKVHGAKLVQISREFISQTDMKQLTGKILDVAMEVTSADAGTLYLLKEERLEFEIIVTKSLGIRRSEKEIELPPVALERENVCAYSVLENKIINIANVKEDKTFKGPGSYDEKTGYTTVSMIVVPLQDLSGEVIGAIQLINAQDDSGAVIPFAPSCEAMLGALGSQAAMCILKMLDTQKDSEKQ